MKQVLWRNSSIYPRLGIIDAKGVFPLLLFILHWSYWTLALAILGIGIFVVLERRGLTPVVGLRYLKLYVFNGKRRWTRVNEVIIRKRNRW